MMIAGIVAGVLALTSQQTTSAAQSISSCPDLEEANNPSELHDVSGLIVSDQLHSGFRLRDCENARLSVAWDTLSASRRESLDIYLRNVRGDRTGLVSFPVVLVGRIKPVDGTSYRELVVEDFRIP